MIDLIAALITLLGAAFALASAVGLVRLPDILTRMHGSTKAGTLGTGLILIGSAITLADDIVTLRVIAILAFLVLTVPVGAHLIGRAAYRTGVPLWGKTVIDELAANERTATPRGDTTTERRDP